MAVVNRTSATSTLERLLPVAAELELQPGYVLSLTCRIRPGPGIPHPLPPVDHHSHETKLPRDTGLWECDGSLRDIYVQDTGAAHWNRFDQLLSQYECAYTFDGVLAPFPGSHIALGNRDGSHLLSILLGGPVEICCHFFIAEQLELDISPKEITGQLAHEEVLLFVENLADALGLSVDITPENAEQMPFLTYLPQSKMRRIHDDP